MKDKFLQAEIWEIQTILYWLLALALYETKHMVLFYFVFVWSIITTVGIIVKLMQAKYEQIKNPTISHK